MAGETLTYTVAVDGTAGVTVNSADDPKVYGLVDPDASQGARGWRRTYVESPWVDGRALVSAVADVEIGQLTFRVFGTLAEQKTRTQVLIAAFSQITYTTTITIDGQAHTWSDCEPADFTIGTGGSWSRVHWMAGQQNVTFQIPHGPGW